MFHSLRFSAIVMCALCFVTSFQSTMVLAQGGRERSLNMDPSVTRDHILANHDRRKEQLKKLLVEAREKVDDHESGRILLEDDEYAKFTKRVTLYANKLEKMEAPMDDREIDRIMQRQKMRTERIREEL